MSKRSGANIAESYLERSLNGARDHDDGVHLAHSDVITGSHCGGVLTTGKRLSEELSAGY